MPRPRQPALQAPRSASPPFLPTKEPPLEIPCTITPSPETGHSQKESEIKGPALYDRVFLSKSLIGIWGSSSLIKRWMRKRPAENLPCVREQHPDPPAPLAALTHRDTNVGKGVDLNPKQVLLVQGMNPFTRLNIFWRKGFDRHDWVEFESENYSLSCVRLFVTPWTVAHQALLSMGFSRQEYWSELPFPPPGDLPNPGIEPRSPTLPVDPLPTDPPAKPLSRVYLCLIN